MKNDFFSVDILSCGSIHAYEMHVTHCTTHNMDMTSSAVIIQVGREEPGNVGSI